MSLVVEDGTGLPNAESYVSVADAFTYASDHGLTFAIAGDDAALAEQALRRATAWLDATFRKRYPGFRTTYRFQALEWPRTGAIDNGAVPQPIGMNEIPTEIIKATIEAAFREKATPGALAPDITPGEINRVITAGSVSLTRANVTATDQLPIVTVIENILKSLLPDPGGFEMPMLLKV